jgi:hypothetical protein
MDDQANPELHADPAAVDAVLTTSRSMVAVATRSLGAVAEETTIAQYRALVVLASRGPQRIVDLAEALDVAPSTAGRMCDRLVRKGLVRRHRARGDRRAVLIAEILGRLPLPAQQAVAQAPRAFADAAGEVPDSERPAAMPVGEGPAPHRRGSAERGGSGLPVTPARDRTEERA